ncbi:hypothetical protein [Cerasicoccus fimbriatus]|uniref:hypothetical protein n=1 Tax=Cerasicoccus fimbriatus TaxID=3014554 RepID=UPI0022B40044|nr:hypothetical protein [Cerasicoccus sp. TK19100]
MSLPVLEPVEVGEVAHLSKHLIQKSKRHIRDAEFLDPWSERMTLLDMPTINEFRGGARDRDHFLELNQLAVGRRNRKFTAYRLTVSPPDIVQALLMVLQPDQRNEFIGLWLKMVDEFFVERCGDVPRQFAFHTDKIRLHVEILFLRANEKGKAYPMPNGLGDTRRRDLISLAVYAGLYCMPMAEDYHTPELAYWAYELTTITKEFLRQKVDGWSAESEVRLMSLAAEALSILEVCTSDPTLDNRPKFCGQLRKAFGPTFPVPGSHPSQQLKQFLDRPAPELIPVADDIPRWLETGRLRRLEVEARRKEDQDMFKERPKRQRTYLKQAACEKREKSKAGQASQVGGGATSASGEQSTDLEDVIVPHEKLSTSEEVLAPVGPFMPRQSKLDEHANKDEANEYASTNLEASGHEPESELGEGDADEPEAFPQEDPDEAKTAISPEKLMSVSVAGLVFELYRAPQVKVWRVHHSEEPDESEMSDEELEGFQAWIQQMDLRIDVMFGEDVERRLRYMIMWYQKERKAMVKPSQPGREPESPVEQPEELTGGNSTPPTLGIHEPKTTESNGDDIPDDERKAFAEWVEKQDMRRFIQLTWDSSIDPVLLQTEMYNAYLKEKREQSKLPESPEKPKFGSP